MTKNGHFRNPGLKILRSQFGLRVALPACKAGFPRALQGFVIEVVKHWQKRPFFPGSDVQWPKMDISGSRGLKFFLSEVGSRVTLNVDKS